MQHDWLQQAWLKKQKWLKNKKTVGLFNNSAQDTKQKHFRDNFPPFASSDATFTASFNYTARRVAATGFTGVKHQRFRRVEPDLGGGTNNQTGSLADKWDVHWTIIVFGGDRGGVRAEFVTATLCV